MRLRRQRQRAARISARSGRTVSVLLVWRLHVCGVTCVRNERQLYWSGSGFMSTHVVPKPVSIQDFISELHKFPEQAFVPTSEILGFLERTSVAPETLEPYLNWDRQHYTRNLID